MQADAILTLVILACMFVLLVTEWCPPGVTGLLTIAALVTTNVLPSREAFAGLMNPAVITVGCMYVLSAAVTRTGAAALVADRIADSKSRSSPLSAYYGILAITMLLSGFVNNTPLVVIFLPLVLGLAHRVGEAPSRLLIPLSFVSILGGACTLIGTSTNLVVAASLFEVSGGQLELGMFDFAPLGVILALSGGALIVVFRKQLLPVRTSLELPTQKGLALEYMTELELRDDSPLLGRSLQELNSEALLGEQISVLEVIRGEVIRLPRPEVCLEQGDLLLVKGSPDAILQLRLAEERRRGKTSPDSVRNVALTLFEVLVTPESDWIGQRISTLEMHDRFDASVFAIQRHGSHLREELGNLRLLAGDVLLIQGSDDSLRRLRASGSALVVEGVDQLSPDMRRAPLAILSLGVFVALAVTRVLPVEVAALIAALFVILTRTLSPRDAYQSVGWDVLFLVAGTLAMGKAFEQTGLASETAEAVVQAAAPLGLHVLLGAMLLFTALMTQILSNNATAAIMTPVAYELGSAFEFASPMLFVMAVAFGANCSFLTPISFKTNLIVYGPGGYRFRDFLRPGIPLTLLYLAIAALLLPVLY